MKKLSILLSLALVAMLSGAALAELNTDITGSFTADFRYYDQDASEKADYVLEGRGTVSAKLTASTGGGNVKISLGTVAEAKTGDDKTWDKDPYAPSKAMNLSIDSAKAEITGAWIKDGPEVTTTFGRHSVDYSPWVASGKAKNPTKNDTIGVARNGIEVSGIELGPVSLAVYHGWAAPYSVKDDPDTAEDETANYGQDRPTAFKATGSLDVVDFGFVAINREELIDGALVDPAKGRDRVWDFAVDGSVTPAEGIDLDAVFASDGQSETSAYEVNATLSTIPEITLSGTVWQTEAGFAPRYAQWNKDDEEYVAFPHRDVAALTGSKGFGVSAETEQSGITLNGGVEVSTNAAGADKETKTTLGASTTVQNFDLGAKVTMTTPEGADTSTKTVITVGTEVAAIELDYEGTFETGKNAKNKFTAKTTVDTPIADGVVLSGGFQLEETKDTAYWADADWTAPNGISLGLHYTNQDRKKKHGEWEDTYKGFYVTAGYKASF